LINRELSIRGHRGVKNNPSGGLSGRDSALSPGYGMRQMGKPSIGEEGVTAAEGGRDGVGKG